MLRSRFPMPPTDDLAAAIREEVKNVTLGCRDSRQRKERLVLWALSIADRAAKNEREVCALVVETAYPCSCDEAYKTRKLTAPDCFACVPLAEAAECIRARSDAQPGEKS